MIKSYNFIKNLWAHLFDFFKQNKASVKMWNQQFYNFFLLLWNVDDDINGSPKSKTAYSGAQLEWESGGSEPLPFSKVPISLTRTFRKKKHAHTSLFFFEKSWAKFFYKPFVHLFLQFNSIINRGFYVCKYFLKKLVEFYLTETNFAKIYIFLNVYSIKMYSFKVMQRS